MAVGRAGGSCPHIQRTGPVSAEFSVTLEQDRQSSLFLFVPESSPLSRFYLDFLLSLNPGETLS